MSAAAKFTEAVESQVRAFTANLSKTLSDEFQKEFQAKVLSAFGATVPAKAKGKRGRPPGTKNKVPVAAAATDKPKEMCRESDGQPVLAKGLCRKHYYQQRRAELAAGTAVKGKRGRPRKETALPADAQAPAVEAVPAPANGEAVSAPAPF